VLSILSQEGFLVNRIFEKTKIFVFRFFALKKALCFRPKCILLRQIVGLKKKRKPLKLTRL
jgi:hypothetical protein